MPVELTSGNDVECLICGRHFEESRICLHQDICKKSFKSKRKPFDSFKQRVKGTMLEKHMESIRMRIQTQSPHKMEHGNWRKAHEDFISTVKAAKEKMKTPQPEKELDPCAPNVHKPKALESA